MAAIKHEAKIHFPEGHIYVLMNDEWSVEVTGEQGIDGELVGMVSWDFKTRKAWEDWGNHIINRLEKLKQQQVSSEELSSHIYDLDYSMPAAIRLELQ